MTLIKTHWSLSECFRQFRLTKDIHLGGGDIRLSIDIQDAICKLSEATTSNEKHSFARSQAIEFEEWYWSENCPYYWMGGTYSHGETEEVVSTSELYDLFLDHQKKQQEGKGE